MIRGALSNFELQRYYKIIILEQQFVAMSGMRVVLLVFFLLALGGVSEAQTYDDISRYMPTENLDAKKRGNKWKYRPKRKHYEVIYKRDTKGTLYGNPCALEATRKMGFEYVIQTPGLPGAVLLEDVRVNNFLVNLKLIFTRSPFWKLILNKKLKKCQQKSGDIVG